MNFFTSVFSDEPDSPKPGPQSNAAPQNAEPTETWTFGGMLKTLTTKSESVLETYKRDLKEFGSGLKKEIETAQGSIGNITNSIDEIGSSVLKSTAQMISHGKDSILAVDLESDSSESNIDRSVSVNSKGYYSRFENLVRGIQCDASTYSEEIEDLEDYKKWKLGFDLGEKKEECESLISENSGMESIYKKLVGSGSVDEETFWCRYYYRVYKLKLAEDLRANIVKRAISTEEEDLSWDVDDEQEDEVKGNVKEINDLGDEEVGKSAKIAQRSEIEEMGGEESLQIVKVKPEEIVNVVKKSKEVEVANVGSEEVGVEKRKEEASSSKVDEERDAEGKEGSNGETSKDSDFSVVSSHPSNAEEDDLGWDEIEDLSSIDEKKDEKRVSSSGSPSKTDFQKRLSAAEEEEDLNWDIEDDDEPVKA